MPSAAVAGVRRGVKLCVGPVRVMGSFLCLGVCASVLASSIVSTSHANQFPAGAIFSNGLADNTNPYDAPVPGFVGPDGEGTANFFDMSDREDPGPIDGYGKRNYVNPVFLSWADRVEAYVPAPDVALSWLYSGEVLDAVTGDNFAVASLGDLDARQIAAGLAPGFITVSFEKPLYNAPGADVVIFENGFISNYDTVGGSIRGQVFAELAYLEVSSDGVTFVRFPSISRTPARVGPYGTILPGNVYNLVGKHANAYGQSWGTPFDFSDLAHLPEVLDGRVDLNRIRFIRIVDIPGSGDFKDSLGNPIYDAWVTWGSGGADIEAIGAISQPYYYEEWRSAQNVPKPEDDLDAFVYVGTETEDTNGDGVPNLLAYLLALDPRSKVPAVPLEFAHDALTGQSSLSFSRDVRVADYSLVLERSANAAFPLVWEPVLRLSPMNVEEQLVPQIVSVDSVSLHNQASLGVVRRYEVVIGEAAPSRPMQYFRLRAEPVEQ